MQLLHQPFLLQKLSSGADGDVQAVHVVGEAVGVFHVVADVVHAQLVGERGEESKEQLRGEHERWRQAVKLSSRSNGSWQAVHVVGDAVHVVRDAVGVFHVGAGGVLGVVSFCDHGAHSGCSDDDSQSQREGDFAAN